MSTFKFHVAPKTGGGFTTRPVQGAEFTDATVLDPVATQTGVTAEKCGEVFLGILSQFLLCGAGCAKSTSFLGKLSIRPTSGGSAMNPDDFHTPDDINAGVSLNFNLEAIRDWRATLSIESQGLVGLITPQIDTVINLKTNRINHYTAAKMCMFKGDHCDFDPEDVTQGIWLILAGGPVGGTRIDTYGVLSPTEGSFLMPAGTTGSVTLRIVAFINGSLRSSTYTTALEP